MSDPVNDPAARQCYNERLVLPNNYYLALVDYSSAAVAIIRVLPLIRDIFNCSFITVTYTMIVTDVCPDLLNVSSLLSIVATICAAGLTAASLFICVFFRCELKEASRKEAALTTNNTHPHTHTPDIRNYLGMFSFPLY